MLDNPRRPDWAVVRTHCERLVETSRKNLETQGLSPEVTEFERGQIAAFRSVLRLADPAPDIPTDTPVIY